MCKSARNSVKHKLADQVVELKDDRMLFARLLIVAWDKPEGSHWATWVYLIPTSPVCSDRGTSTMHRQKQAHGHPIIYIRLIY